MSNILTTSAHKIKGVKRVITVRFYPFVSTGNGASSRGTRRTDNARGQLETGRFLFWTEDSRTHAAIDEKFYSYYTYDHSGGSCASREQSQACLSYAEMEQRRRSQRRLKLTGKNELMDVNAEYMNASSALNEPTLYPSAYMVLTNKGYTKHYYAGTERVAARLGGGGLDALYHVIGNDVELQKKADILFKQSLEQVNHRVLHENNLECIKNNEFTKEELSHWIDGIPHQMKAEVEIDHGQFKDMVHSMLVDLNNGQEKDVYFYHSDHLGSASWITDFEGIAVQHLQYMPYGEPYINQHPFGYSERFTFTGKERDEETGYGYFGARYMDHELMTMWLSVDPMADKYPSISPYAYCAWNPIKLVDPDGRDIDPSCLDDWNTKKAAIQNKKNELIAQKNELSNKTSFWGSYSRNRKINKLNKRIESLDETLSTMSNLEGDKSTTYTLSNVSENGGVSLILEGEKKGMVSIASSCMSSFVHEVTHAGQFYSNDIGFFKNGVIAAYDIYDEAAAYKAALAYDPNAYDNKHMDMWQVTPEWVRPRSDTYSVSNGCGSIPINLNSTAAAIKKSGINNLGEYHTYSEIPSGLVIRSKH